MIQVQPGWMRPQKKADIENDHPKFCQDALDRRKIAEFISCQYLVQGVAAQIDQGNDAHQQK